MKVIDTHLMLCPDDFVREVYETEGCIYFINYGGFLSILETKEFHKRVNDLRHAVKTDEFYEQ